MSRKDLLQKFREDTISREEFDQLAEIVNDPASEGEVKDWMEEHWEDMDFSDEHAPGVWDWENETQFEALRRKIDDRDKMV